VTWATRRGVKVWTGLSEDDERHGTLAGHQAHLAANEPPCLPCRDARNQWQAENRDRRKTPCTLCGTPTGRDLCRSCATIAGNQGRDYDRHEFCTAGHRLTPDNRTARGDGCLTCHRERSRRYRAEAKRRRVEAAIALRWTGE
jgi:hypothetical protein